MTTAMSVQTDWPSGLDDEQRRAAEHADGPLIVLAGPGTGKTRTLIARVLRLLDSGAEPDSILALTFSVKAAEEMRERLTERTAASVADRIQMLTFHSFGRTIVARFGDMIGLRPDPTMMDSAQLTRLLRQLIRTSNVFGDCAAQGLGSAIEKAIRFIDECRYAGRSSGEALTYAEGWRTKALANEDGLAGDALEAGRFKCDQFARFASVYGLYETACIERGLVTFSDFLALPVRIFEEHAVAASVIRAEIRHVLVDEFQDVNGAQIRLLTHLAVPGENPDLCAVGDDDQAIYGFRGADTRAFERFASIWSDCTTIPLTGNYRSRSEIIDVTNEVIGECSDRFAPDKRFHAAGDGPLDGGAVEGVIVDDDHHLGLAIAAMIGVDREQHTERRWSDYGVIVRTNTAADQIADELDLQGIPVASRHALTPLDDPGIQDLLAWIRLVLDDTDANAAQRLLIRPPHLVPTPMVTRWRQQWERSASDPASEDTRTFCAFLAEQTGDDSGAGQLLTTLGTLRKEAATELADRFIEQLIRSVDVVHAEDLSGRERAGRIENVVALLRFVRNKQQVLDEPGDLRAFMSYYNDLSPKEKQFQSPSIAQLDRHGEEEDDGTIDAVHVLTAHKAKGLEFDTVFAAKVRPRGFPVVASGPRDGADGPPEAFTLRLLPEHADEERRLFYVACTRAQRRLVLLAKRKKSRGKSVDYFDELRYDHPELDITLHEGADLIGRAGLNLPESAALDELERNRETLIKRESTRARQSAYAALHDAAESPHDGDELGEINARLADAAARLHALRVLRETGRLPENMRDDEHLAKLRARYVAGDGPVSVTRPMTGPLKLSFSRISAYERCPRCFYVKYVLGLDESTTSELNIGSTIHVALERFFKELRAAEGEGEAAPGVERLLAIGQETIRQRLPMGRPFEPEVLEQVSAQLTNALERLHDRRDNILEIERSVKFRYPCPLSRYAEGHIFHAKIDRVDQPASGELRIIDYKTGKAWGKLTEPKPTDLQLAIYAMALPHLLGDGALEGVDGTAEYWLLSTGERGSIALSELDLDKVGKRIDKAITGMLEGKFEKAKKCSDGLCELLPEE